MKTIVFVDPFKHVLNDFELGFSGEINVITKLPKCILRKNCYV